MSAEIIEITETLWLDTTTTRDTGLFHICDSIHGEALIDIDEIPAFIAALQALIPHKEEG